MQFVRLVMLAILIIGFIMPLPSAVSAQPASALAPTVTSVSPNQGYNYQPTTITITGSDFVATPTAQLNNVPLTNVTFMDGATLTATVPADLPGGAYTLTVTNPDSQSASLAGAFTVLMSGDGSLGTWQAVAPMGTGRISFAAVQSHGYIYAIGGRSSNHLEDYLDSVEYAAIITDGSLSSWQGTTSLLSGRIAPGAATSGGYIYVVGGAWKVGSSNVPTHTVEYAAIQSNGALGQWQTATSLILARAGLAVVASGGFLYALGGYDNTVEYARINSDGSLGEWQMGTMNVLHQFFGAAAAGSYIYALGGRGDSDEYQTVERAIQNPDGSLGQWQMMTSMTTRRTSFGVVATRGYLFAIGGNTAYFNGYLSSVERTQIASDGALTPWQVSTAMTSPRYGHAVATTACCLYALGGADSNGIILNTIERAEINAPRLSSFFPSGVRSDQPTTVAVNGANILPSPTLRLGDSTTLISSFVSTTTVSATIPSGLANGWYTATVTSGDGRTATLTNALRVDGPGPVVVGDLGVTINDGALFTNQVTVTLTIGSITNTALMQVSNDGGFAGALWETYTSHKAWQITQYGNYIIPRVVYVRYKDLSGNVSSNYQDDIILDVNAPTGSVIITSASAAIGEATNAIPSKALSDLSVQATNLQFKIYLPLVVRPGQPCQGCVLVRAILNATDDVSGVGYVMFSNNDANFNNAVWEAYASQMNWQVPSTGTTAVYVKFRDNAGNISTTYSATYTP